LHGLTDSPRPSEASAPLPERATVYWRRPVDEAELGRAGRRWTAVTVAHSAPLIAVAGLLIALNPVTIPVAVILLAHAWIIPGLYAARGANVLRTGAAGEAGAELTALGLLGDLLDHRERELLAETGLALERGRFGIWVVGELGAVLVAPGGRRVYCYCVKATGADLPRGDRIAHLLLALRTDEVGFATVANLTFSGATWRLGRRLRGGQRVARAAARAAAKDAGQPAKTAREEAEPA
jgi:hypothetical protein